MILIVRTTYRDLGTAKRTFHGVLVLTFGDVTLQFYLASSGDKLSVAWYIVLERETPGFDHSVNGKAVAKASAQLDSFAKEKVLPPLMSFFSISPEELAGFAEDHGVSLEQSPSEKWFSADDGLKTVNGLIDGAEKHKLDARVIADLREFQTVLEVAKQHDIGWHLAVDF